MESNSTEDRRLEDILLLAAAVTGFLIAVGIFWYGISFLIERCASEEQPSLQIMSMHHQRSQSIVEPSRSRVPVTVQDIATVPFRIRQHRLLKALPLFDFSAETIQKYESDDHHQNIEATNAIILLEHDEERVADNYTTIENRNRPTTTCSICIFDIRPKDKVFKTSQCHHLFHAKCICDWMMSGPSGADIYCPNCRREICSRSALNRVLLGGDFESDMIC